MAESMPHAPAGKAAVQARKDLLSNVIHKAQLLPRRIVFPEGEQENVLRACRTLVEEKIARVVLVGRLHEVRAKALELGTTLSGMEVLDPADCPRCDLYTEELFRLRQRHGITKTEARNAMRNRNVYASMMVHMGDADALVSGVTQHYPETIRPALQIIRVRDGMHKVSGLTVLVSGQGQPYFLADTTVNIDPTAEDLAEVALCAALEARRFDVTPRVAMLSFSNFGSSRHPFAQKMKRAAELARQKDPTLMIDGEMQADTALMPEAITATHPFSTLRGGANVLIFPNLEAGNIAYKLLTQIGGAVAIGPILMGMAKPVHVLQRGCEAEDIVNIAAIAVVDAQEADAREPLRRAASAA